MVNWFNDRPSSSSPSSPPLLGPSTVRIFTFAAPHRPAHTAACCASSRPTTLSSSSSISGTTISSSGGDDDAAGDAAELRPIESIRFSPMSAMDNGWWRFGLPTVTTDGSSLDRHTGCGGSAGRNIFVTRGRKYSRSSVCWWRDTNRGGADRTINITMSSTCKDRYPGSGVSMVAYFLHLNRYFLNVNIFIEGS